MNETGRIIRNAIVISLALACAFPALSRGADYTTDGRLIVGMGGNCAKASMNNDGKSNPVTCDPNDFSTYGAIWQGALRRDPSTLALFDAKSGMIVAAEDPTRYLTPAPGEAARYWRMLNDRRDSFRNLCPATRCGGSVTAR